MSHSDRMTSSTSMPISSATICGMAENLAPPPMSTAPVISVTVPSPLTTSCADVAHPPLVHQLQARP